MGSLLAPAVLLVRLVPLQAAGTLGALELPAWDQGGQGSGAVLVPLVQALRDRTTLRRAQEVLQLESRRRVYEYVRMNPGVHIRAMERDLRLGLGNLRYHLQLLQEASLVVCLRRGKRRVYFSWDVAAQDRLPLALLREPNMRAILGHLVELGEEELEGVKRILGVSKSTAWAYLQRLVEAGLVVKGIGSVPERYALRDPEAVLRLLGIHEEGMREMAARAALTARPTTAQGL
jgi:DNA-binding transcriptional ArsR family regulator